MANWAIYWLNQAKGDLSNRKNAGTVDDYDWACFAAQQSAEWAVKGLRLSKRF